MWNVDIDWYRLKTGKSILEASRWSLFLWFQVLLAISGISILKLLFIYALEVINVMIYY